MACVCDVFAMCVTCGWVVCVCSLYELAVIDSSIADSFLTLHTHPTSSQHFPSLLVVRRACCVFSMWCVCVFYVVCVLCACVWSRLSAVSLTVVAIVGITRLRKMKDTDTYLIRKNVVCVQGALFAHLCFFCCSDAFFFSPWPSSS